LRQAGLDKTALGRDWLAAAQGALHTTLRVTAPHRKIGYFAPHGPDAGPPALGPARGVQSACGCRVPARRWDRLERLVRYLVRPPLALDRLTESTGGQLLYRVGRSCSHFPRAPSRRSCRR
jgi:hypothetical protein